MVILVIGAGFTNKGAEALLKTTRDELVKRVGDLQFLLMDTPASDVRPAFDSGFLPLSGTAGLHGRFGFLQSLSSVVRSTSATCVADAIRYGSLGAAVRGHYVRRTAGDFDAVIDISGFAYGDVWGSSVLRRRRYLWRRCAEFGRPLIFLPQCWGPFYQPRLAKRIGEVLQQDHVLFFSRDEQSSSYLRELLGKEDDSITPHPDIVFRYAGGNSRQGKQVLRSLGCSMNRPVVGVSPNMQVYSRVRGKGTANEYLLALRDLVLHGLATKDVEVVVQPNTTNAYGSGKDDRYICSLLASMVGRPDRCFCVTEGLSSEQTKGLIGTFEFLVASRFHSLVFALSQAVPVLAVSWSHKYRELLSPFGLGEYVQEHDGIDSKALAELFDRAWDDRQKNSELIAAKSDEFRRDVDAVFDRTAERLTGSGG